MKSSHRFKSYHLASCTGNLLEWYDFGLFAVYASLFSTLFFPPEEGKHALIMTFAILAAGFYCRPIGALIFGYIGDKRGRAPSLRLSILMISLPTLLVGFLPTFDQAGYLAPVLLILIRLWQGISLGGEFSGNLIYLVETAPKQHRALFASLVPTGANLGILLATGMSLLTSHLFDDTHFKAYGWRIPYLFSGCLSCFIYYTRLQLQETLSFENAQRTHTIVHNPISHCLTHDKNKIVATMLLTCMGGTFYYLCFVFLPSFIGQYTPVQASAIEPWISYALIVMLILVPIAGFLCDRIGHRKMMIFNAVMIGCIAVPAFYTLLHQPTLNLTFIITLSALTLISSFEQVTTGVNVVENYPLPARYTGLSVGYNLANALFCGSAPLLCEVLSSQLTPLAPAIYITFCACLTGLTAYWALENTLEPPIRPTQDNT